MANNKVKPAFPGRALAMGYEPGLTKLEWIVTQLVASPHAELDVKQAVLVAKIIIEACAKAESND